MADLTGISAFACGSFNRPGLSTLKYVPIDWLADGEYEEIIASGNFQKAITPSLGGAEWLNMPFEPVNGDGWQQGSRTNAQGQQYPQTVGGVIRNLRPAVDAELVQMEGHRRFLVHLTDKNGKDWLIGRLHEPLRFSATSQGGGQQGGLNSYSFRFEGATTKRAFGYTTVY